MLEHSTLTADACSYRTVVIYSVLYHALKRMQAVLLRTHARSCAPAEIAITPFHVSGMARYALRRVSAQIATQSIMACFPRHVQPWTMDGLMCGMLVAGS